MANDPRLVGFLDRTIVGTPEWGPLYDAVSAQIKARAKIRSATPDTDMSAQEFIERSGSAQARQCLFQLVGPAFVQEHFPDGKRARSVPARSCRAGC